MSSEPLTMLGGLTVQQFLDEYWQKKPLLIRNALPEAVNLISPDELAGLSLDEAVEARIVVQKGAALWDVQHGPFNEDTFKDLPESHWSLLIQAVDHHVPACSHLLDLFTFIPNWRIDDLMISYAPDQGSVGPHYDYYDVFLIQGLGQREWRVGQLCDEHSLLLPGLPLKILGNFEQTESWVLNPGDMLYLPPGLAHWGIALKESMTLSVGFRAPGYLDLIQGYVDSLQDALPAHMRYSDPELALHENPGQLSDEEIGKIHALLCGLVDDPQKMRQWLGKAMSESKYEKDLNAPDEPYLSNEVMTLLKEGYPFQRDEGTRLLFTEKDGGIDGFYINGGAVELHPKAEQFARYLAQHRVYDNMVLIKHCQSAMALQLLTMFLNKGYLYIAIEED